MAEFNIKRYILGHDKFYPADIIEVVLIIIFIVFLSFIFLKYTNVI